MTEEHFHVTKEQQIKELSSRVTPILNVNSVVVNNEGKFLMGHRATMPKRGLWQFGGGRMKYTETPQEAAERILATEFKGVKAQLKKLITAISTMGDDDRANGVTLYYLFEYKSGEPETNEKNDGFQWMSKDEFLTTEKVTWFGKKVIEEIDAAIRTMNTTEDEILVEVDKDDKDIGTITKRDAHNTTERYHRAAHIMVFDSKGNVVLQKRSFNKLLRPNWWDMAGGHQAYGQTISQAAAAETSEELGITPKLTEKSTGLYHGGKQSEWYHLFYGISDGPYGFDRNEVSEVGVFDPIKLLQGEYNDSYQIMEHVFQYTEELRNIWEPLKNNF